MPEHAPDSREAEAGFTPYSTVGNLVDIAVFHIHVRYQGITEPPYRNHVVSGLKQEVGDVVLDLARGLVLGMGRLVNDIAQYLVLGIPFVDTDDNILIFFQVSPSQRNSGQGVGFEQPERKPAFRVIGIDPESIHETVHVGGHVVVGHDIVHQKHGLLDFIVGIQVFFPFHAGYCFQFEFLVSLPGRDLDGDPSFADGFLFAHRDFPPSEFLLAGINDNQSAVYLGGAPVFHLHFHLPLCAGLIHWHHPGKTAERVETHIVRLFFLNPDGFEEERFMVGQRLDGKAVITSIFASKGYVFFHERELRIDAPVGFQRIPFRHGCSGKSVENCEIVRHIAQHGIGAALVIDRDAVVFAFFQSHAARYQGIRAERLQGIPNPVVIYPCADRRCPLFAAFRRCEVAVERHFRRRKIHYRIGGLVVFQIFLLAVRAQRGRYNNPVFVVRCGKISGFSKHQRLCFAHRDELIEGFFYGCASVHGVGKRDGIHICQTDVADFSTDSRIVQTATGSGQYHFGYCYVGHACEFTGLDFDFVDIDVHLVGRGAGVESKVVVSLFSHIEINGDLFIFVFHKIHVFAQNFHFGRV